MIEIKFIFAIIAVTLMLMVTWGLRHSLSLKAFAKVTDFSGWSWRLFTITDHREFAFLVMRLGFTFWHIKGILRIGWWDVVRPALGWAGVMNEQAATATVFYANMSFISLAIGGAVCGLIALWALIPDDKRSDWNIFTAPFFPWGLAVHIGVRRK